MKILYVEHDDDNLYMLKTRLERRGNFEVLAAEDSEQGCKLAVTEHPDVILIDLEMPVMDRWEPVRTLKKSKTFRSSACPRMRRSASVRKPLPRGAMSSIAQAAPRLSRYRRPLMGNQRRQAS
jgi:CheY-like chemotaxis protein